MADSGATTLDRRAPTINIRVYTINGKKMSNFNQRWTDECQHTTMNRQMSITNKRQMSAYNQQ